MFVCMCVLRIAQHPLSDLLYLPVRVYFTRVETHCKKRVSTTSLRYGLKHSRCVIRLLSIGSCPLHMWRPVPPWRWPRVCFGADAPALYHHCRGVMSGMSRVQADSVPPPRCMHAFLRACFRFTAWGNDLSRLAVSRMDGRPSLPRIASRRGVAAGNLSRGSGHVRHEHTAAGNLSRGSGHVGHEHTAAGNLSRGSGHVRRVH